MPPRRSSAAAAAPKPRQRVEAVVIADSDSSSSDDGRTPSDDAGSGAVTPSTAATSVRARGKNGSAGGSGRSTPRRGAAAVAATKLKLAKVEGEAESSEEESEDEDVLAERRKAKGKGRAVSVSSEDDDEEDEEDDWDAEEADESGGSDSDISIMEIVSDDSDAPLAAASKGKGKQAAPVKAAKKKFVPARLPKKAAATKPSKGKGKASESESEWEIGSDDYGALVVDDSGSDEDVTADVKPVISRPAPRKGVTVNGRTLKGWKKLSRFEKTEAKLHANHPELEDAWGDLAEIKPSVPFAAEQPAGLTLKLLPFQREGLGWMVKQEKGTWKGGMLADEMGMGKTIQTIALILSDWTPDSGRSTLVLAPTVAIMQWRNEIQKFTSGIKVLVWHGGNRADTVKELQKYDIILTSYAVLESAYRREHKGFSKNKQTMKEDSIVHKINWHRVILDEAHNIKERQSNTAKAAFALKGTYRWCLSGTPLQNRVGELYSLIRFLGADPFSYYYCKDCTCKSLSWLCLGGKACVECGHSSMSHICYWNNEVLKPIQYSGPGSADGDKANRKLAILLDRMMLRRTKVERADDLGLPPRVVMVRRDYFTEEEEELYKSLYQDVKRKFNTFAEEGTVLNNYSNIFTLITRMRQMADHPDLVLKSRTAQAVQHASGDQITELLTCRICLDEAEDPIRSSCRHVFCRECARQYLETAVERAPECPVCRSHMTIDLQQDAIEQVENANTLRQGMLDRIDPSKWRTSTKIEALVEELSKVRTEEHTLKSLVFSQFNTMLDLVARRLQLAGFKIVRLQGTMTPTARDNTIKYFTENPDVTVFLISLKAGGVALNLTEASRVFILDPWWNPAVELQAMDRIHRLGQHRPIVVKRLVIENSIESRILELQKKKESMTAHALGDDDSAMGRLTPEDLQFLFRL